MDEKKPFGSQAIKTAGSVEYSEDSVVSKQLIKRGGGTISLFAFDKGQSLSEHTAPFDALILVLDGRAEVTISGTPHFLVEGEVILLPAGEPHALRAPEKFKMMLIMIRS